jgi:hypothetical protein
MPPVLPIRKDPGLMPPTVAGPMMVMPFFLATWRISRARWEDGQTRSDRGGWRGTYSLGHTLSDDGNGLDLGELHELHGGGVDTPRGGKVNDGIDVGVLGHGLLDVLVDGEQGLAGAPVHLADELAAKGVDNAGDGGGLALADEVEVKHALDGTGLEAVDEASGLVVEEGMGGVRAQGAGGRGEAADVVVGGEAAAGGSSGGGGGHGDDGVLDVRV